MGNGYHAVALREIGRLFGSGTAVGLSDAELLDRFAADRDEVAFAALVDRHGPMVLGLCRRIVRDAHEAEDVFQAAFLVLARKAGAIRVDDSLGRWLYTVARRLALRVNADLARRDKLRLSDLAPISPSDDLERRELAAIIHDELDRLPTSHRNVVILCYLEGVTHEETARRLRWPLGSVKGRLVRAREILKARLTRRGLALSSGTLAATLRPNPVSASLLERTLSAAIGYAASRAGLVPAVILANGVLTTMFVSKLKLGATAVLALCVGAFATVATGDGPPDGPKSRGAAKSDSVRRKTDDHVNVNDPPRAASVDRPNEADNDREAIERLLQHPETIERLLQHPEMIERLLQHPDAIERLRQQLNAHRPATGERTDALVSRITRELRTLHADVEKTDDEIMRLKRANESKMNQIAELERRIEIETAIAERRDVRPRVDPTNAEPHASKRADRQPNRIDLYGRVTIRENPVRRADGEPPAARPQVDKNRNVEARIDELIRELAELKEQIGK